MISFERAAGRLSLRLQRLGPLALAGIALLFAAFVMVFSMLMPMQQRASELQAALATAVRHPSLEARSAQTTTSANAFVARLPLRTDLPLVLATVLQQARAAGLSLDQGAYDMSSGKSKRVGRYVISLPVQGTYPQLRRFVDATLLAVPAASVESLRLAREKVGSATVTAEIKFTVFVREVDPGASR